MVNGWTIKDESRKTYTFGNRSLGEIKINSLPGTDNSTDIYWNSEINIWNNDRDSLYLFDSEGNIVHYESYGY
jgi:micrococcal nuclease